MSKDRKPTKEGLYDNRHTMRREVWHDQEGELRMVQAISFRLYNIQASPFASYPPFGAYPDLDGSYDSNYTGIRRES